MGACWATPFRDSSTEFLHWEIGCQWRRVSLDGLENQQRDDRIALKSASIAGQRASLSADLAIAPIPQSACHGGVEEIPPEAGLRPLPLSRTGMTVSDNPSPAVTMLADRIRALRRY